MKVTEILSKATDTLFSFELLPPRKGESVQTIFNIIDDLLEFNPAFIDVTYHQEEFTYDEAPDGTISKKIRRKRPGTVGIVGAIKYKYSIDVVPHLICGGFTRDESENALIDLDFLGIENVLLLRGDPPIGLDRFIPEKNGNSYASELLQQVKQLNAGVYLEPDLKDAVPTKFCVGVAGYPEKHYEAPNLDRDLNFLKKKVDLGADYIVTQMFFDNQYFFDFERRCREKGIQVPIIPGLKPLTAKSQISVLPRTFHINIPAGLVDEVEKAKNSDAVKEIGIEWCVQQSKELMKKGVPCLHYYIMSQSGPTREIARRVF
ncbi:MAG: methylenetetrahydrofolate reductase [NAD(P)H] [Planctomycetota bacterium]